MRGAAAPRTWEGVRWKEHRLDMTDSWGPRASHDLVGLGLTVRVSSGGRGSVCIGDEESSRFRKNIFAYAESHGLGQSGGGGVDREDRVLEKFC